MHRSGTSAWARALAMLGAQLGQEFESPNKWNPKGYWEDIRIRELDDSLFFAMGRCWDSLSPIPEYAFESSIVAELKPKAQRLIQERLFYTDLFAFKDPRICPLLPFWNDVLDSFGTKTHYLLVVRHPLSVARSLRARDDFGEVKSVYLWLLHTVYMLRYTEGRTRVVCSYDNLIENPSYELKRVAEQFGLHFDPTSASFKSFQNEFFDPSLRHSKFSAGDLQSHSSFPECVFKIYQVAEKLASDSIDFDSVEVLEALEAGVRELEDKKKLLLLHDEVRFRLQEVQFRLQEVQFRLQEVFESRSWKITKPLRFAEPFRSISLDLLAGH